jgi:hypothetical protein
MVGSDDKGATILEKWASDLCECVESIGEQQVQFARTSELRRDIFPVIVTNATLALIDFDPSKISLEDGILPEVDQTIDECPWIQFRKSLSTRFQDDSITDLETARSASERSVFVVTAQHLPKFLASFNPF